MSARAPSLTALALALLALLACSPAEEPRDEAPARAPEPSAPRFATRREHRLDAKPEWVRAADLDGDGYEELALATVTPGSLRVHRGGAEGLAPPLRVAVGDYPLAPVAVRRGGRRVLAVASRAERELALYDPFGAEPTRALEVHALDTIPRALAAGDLGADGAEELLVAGDGRRLTLVRADGSVAEAELAAHLPRCALIAADGAGAWIGYQDTRALHFRPWVEGALAAPSAVVALGGIPRALIQADLDGDGELELVVVGGDHHAWVFGWGAGGGSAAWRAGEPGEPRLWPAQAIPIDVRARDLDGDGRVELALLQEAALTWTVWRDLTAEGPRERLTGYAGQTPLSIALADEDGDGRADLFVTCRDAFALAVAHGDGPAFARAPLTPVGGYPTSLAAADLDGDGRAEVLVLNSKDDSLSVLRNDAGRLIPALTLPVGPSPRSVQVADLDGDGRGEVAALSVDAGGARVVLFARGADGALAPRSDRPPFAVGRTARALLPLDLDLDGRPDLALADDEGGRVAVLLNSGDLVFAPAAELALAGGPRALARIELDGDPGPELAVALGEPGAGVAFVDVVAGERGVELRELGRMAFPGAVADLAVADYDGDGREDVALVGDALRVLSRQADGPGFDARPPAPVALEPRQLVAGDIDGDGRADLAATCQLGHLVELWLARGDREDGSFTLARQPAIGAGVGPFALALTDLDGDGRLDLVVANAHGDDVSAVVQR